MNPLPLIIGVPIGFSTMFLLVLWLGPKTVRRGRHRAVDDLDALIDATRETRVSAWDGVSDEVLVLMHESACAEIAVRMIAEHGHDAIETHLREAS